MTPRKALALAVLAGATTAPACAYIGVAHAQAPACGGHDATHVIPVGESVECVNARILRDGVRWESGIHVRFDGTFQFGVRRPTPAPTDIPIEFAFHYGDSGSGTLAVFETTLLKGQTQVALAGSINPADLADHGCHTQGDGKAYNSDLDTPQNRVRLMGPHFTFENCQPAPPTTAPATTVPGTSSPTTSPHSSTPGNSVSTTGVPSPSSVVGGNLPATGPGWSWVGYSIVAVLVIWFGLLLIVAARLRRTS